MRVFLEGWSPSAPAPEPRAPSAASPTELIVDFVQFAEATVLLFVELLLQPLQLDGLLARVDHAEVVGGRLWVLVSDACIQLLTLALALGLRVFFLVVGEGVGKYLLHVLDFGFFFGNFLDVGQFALGGRTCFLLEGSEVFSANGSELSLGVPPLLRGLLQLGAQYLLLIVLAQALSKVAEGHQDIEALVAGSILSVHNERDWDLDSVNLVPEVQDLRRGELIALQSSGGDVLFGELSNQVGHLRVNFFQTRSKILELIHCLQILD
eukprot:CAMPEP_0170498120 /NCGR_PEP_ID=MMETSP0208-20121228/26902_1 /TAXON_ID=197538 /ORGANISM="Strombidium inclinatum, Strain S3" /LENGTH=265 /DNA_ID=CAMNT_0010775199 /DNA_START=1357 /DNA_END=2156 /DNA_ORIENTATION=+